MEYDYIACQTIRPFLVNVFGSKLSYDFGLSRNVNVNVTITDIFFLYRVQQLIGNAICLLPSRRGMSCCTFMILLHRVN